VLAEARCRLPSCSARDITSKDLQRPVPHAVTGMAEAGTRDCRDDGQSENERAAAVHELSDLGCHREHLLPFLETEILQRLGSVAIEPCGALFVAAAARQVTLRNPCGRAMRGRRELSECIVGLRESGLRLVEPIL
jgi:hypothetical protein